MAAVPVQGPVRLTLRFPEFRSIYGEPLISTGRTGAGDLVYVTYLGRGLVRFGHDSWNYGPAETSAVRFDPDKEQVVEVEMGSLGSDQAGLMDAHTRFQLRFNGGLLASRLPSVPSNRASGRGLWLQRHPGQHGVRDLHRAGIADGGRAAHPAAAARRGGRGLRPALGQISPPPAPAPVNRSSSPAGRGRVTPSMCGTSTMRTCASATTTGAEAARRARPSRSTTISPTS